MITVLDRQLPAIGTETVCGREPKSSPHGWVYGVSKLRLLAVASHMCLAIKNPLINPVYKPAGYP